MSKNAFRNWILSELLNFQNIIQGVPESFDHYSKLVDIRWAQTLWSSVRLRISLPKKKASTCWDTLQFPTMLSASVEQRGRNVTIMSKICCGPKLNDIVMTSYFWISHYHRITALENYQNVSFEFSNKKVTFIMSDSLVKLIIEMLILAQKFKHGIYL